MANALVKVRELWRRLGIGQEQVDPVYFHQGVIPVDVIAQSAPMVPWPETPVVFCTARVVGTAGARGAVRLLSGRNGCRILRASALASDGAGGMGVGANSYRATGVANNFTLGASVNWQQFQMIDELASQVVTAAYYANILGCRVEGGTAGTDLYTSQFGSVTGFTEAWTVQDVVMSPNMAFQFQAPRVGIAEFINAYFIVQPFVGAVLPAFTSSQDQ